MCGQVPAFREGPLAPGVKFWACSGAAGLDVGGAMKRAARPTGPSTGAPDGLVAPSAKA